MHGQVSMLLDLIPTVSESSGYKFDISLIFFAYQSLFKDILHCPLTMSNVISKQNGERKLCKITITATTLHN